MDSRDIFKLDQTRHVVYTTYHKPVKTLVCWRTHLYPEMYRVWMLWCLNKHSTPTGSDELKNNTE